MIFRLQKFKFIKESPCRFFEKHVKSKWNFLQPSKEEYHTLHYQKSRTLQLKRNVISSKRLDPMNSNQTPLYETGNQRKFINLKCFHLNQCCRGFGSFQYETSSKKTDLNRAPVTSHNDHVLGLLSNRRHYSGNNRSNISFHQYSFGTFQHIFGYGILNVQLNLMRSFHQKIRGTEHQQTIKNRMRSFHHGVQETEHDQPIKNKISSFHYKIHDTQSQQVENKSIVPKIINQSQRNFHTSHSSLQTTKDYYKILGVPRKSTEAQIKKAYFLKAKQYHPDHNKDPEAQKKFQELSEAYVVLGDRKSRALYDPKFRKATTSRSTPRAPMGPSPTAIQGPAPQGSAFSNIFTTAATAIVASELYRKAMSMGQSPAEASGQQMDAESAQKIYEDVEKEQKAGLDEEDEEIEETMDAINDGEYDDENDDDSGEFGDFGDSDDFGGGDDSPPDFGSDSSGDKFI